MRGASSSACDFRRAERHLRVAARMALRPAPLWLPVMVAVSLLRGSCLGASSHSLKYFFTSISEPSQGQPHFVLVGYVDDQLFSYYDSNSRREQPRVSWMEKLGKEDPQFWERETQISRGSEEAFRRDLETLRNRYNQSEGLHTLQKMYGCELRRDGSKGGFRQFGYDGRTYITFDKETFTWVAPDPQAQITQRKWDGLPGFNQRKKLYVEEYCIEWLKKYLSYGNETLLRTEPPVVTMSSRTEVEDGMETHVCRVHGFYPREIDASWTRDGEVWLQDTFRGFLAPNADGTYHYWISIRVDPKERGRYRCRVEHDGLQDPLDLELNEPTDSKSNLGLIIIGCVVAALVIVGVIAGFLVFFKKRQDGYKAATTSDKGSSSSDQGNNQAV
ncbi:BOLA class I histocompatibility antigen, alpha chain BL3-7-like [Erythrolamprus reginae]|uniref:BOLA class I histocompatibility antigen, alpha chain BL3-7-like n=1 Tax=Erythrolamprus reginae TaxID=121349 RepID=UPI00396C9334